MFILCLISQKVIFQLHTIESNRTVIDLIPEYQHLNIFPVGRLDKDTEGLLLITNDGQFSHDLMSPSKHVSKTYEVTSKNPLLKFDIDAFRKASSFLTVQSNQHN